MTRARWLLAALAMILIAAVWYLLMWAPTSEEIETTEAEREAVEAQASQLRTRAASLRQVRDEAPEAAAVLAAADTLVPPEAALPPLLRQMQAAADEAGVRLTDVAPGRPMSVEGGAGGLAAIDVNFAAQGSYFQLVDLLRRMEDPRITGRGVVWRNASVSVLDDPGYPTLVLSITATVYARMDAGAVPPAPEGEADAEAADGDAVEGDSAVTDDATDQTTENAETPPAPPASGNGEEIQ